MIKNRKATFEYDVLERELAGMALSALDVKAIRSGHFSLSGAYVRPVGDELFLIRQDTTTKLLLTRHQLDKFIGRVVEKGLTLVPLRVVLSAGRFKLEIGLCRGKKLHDKRQAQKEKDIARDVLSHRA